MNLRWRLALAATVPLLVALALTWLALRQQQVDLAQRQQALVRQAYDEATRQTLRHYVALAMSAIGPLYDSGRDDDEVKRAAMQQLQRLDYGRDGYFFLYDYEGRNLMHPRQPELVGRNLIDLRDASGLPVIRRLVDTAKAGGGFVDYRWNRPSTQQQTAKVAYVVGLDRWGWMFGTGTYNDEIEPLVAELDAQLAASLTDTQRRVAWTAAAALAVLLVSVLGLSLTELRAADAKLRLLARRLVRSQEDEREWLARELHDSTSQTLASAKLLTETALARLPADEPMVRPLLERASRRLHDTLEVLRRVSHRLRPTELDTLGLPSALQHLGRETCTDAGLGFRFEGPADDLLQLPPEVRTTLFRIAQEALANTIKHAGAASVSMRLVADAEGVALTIADDGRGFDPAALAHQPRCGLGLRNLRERMATLGGRFEVTSGDRGTTLVARVPAAELARWARAANDPDAGDPPSASTGASGAPGAVSR